MFYLQNTQAGFAHNSPILWAIGGGYTQWINEAQKFSEDEADKTILSGGMSRGQMKFVKWPCDPLDKAAKLTVDMQDIGQFRVPQPKE